MNISIMVYMYMYMKIDYNVHNIHVYINCQCCLHTREQGPNWCLSDVAQILPQFYQSI